MSNLPILDRKEAGLTASGLVAGYGQQTVVNGVDLRVEPGEGGGRARAERRR